MQFSHILAVVATVVGLGQAAVASRSSALGCRQLGGN